MTEDRISRLSQRFKTHAVGRKPASNRSRERHSFYLDGVLIERLDETYRGLNHELYPKTITKSVFLEELLEFGLDHLDEIKGSISEQAATVAE